MPYDGAPMSELPNQAGTARVAVIGAGYVGLTTACCLASFGHKVVCGELDPAKVERLSRGEPTIYEEGLDELLRSGLASGRLQFVQGAATAVAGAEVVFLCVPTPQQADGSAEVVDRLIGRADVSVVSNPEFLREGTAIHDSFNPDRIVVGADDPSAAAKVGALFASTGAPLLVTDATTAETIKYACNAFLATKLSFINAVANLCETVGADIRDVLLGMAYDHRIGFDYLRPGPGWGGSCLPKDTRALIYIAEQAGYDFRMLRSAIEANDHQLDSVVHKVRSGAGGDLSGRVVAQWGLAFKAGTDDLRDSPAVDVAARLLAEGARVQAYDPTLSGQRPGVPDGLQAHPDPYAACAGADVLVVLTEWDEFRWVDFDKVRDVMATPYVVDARNLLDPGALRRLGFTYMGIGRR